MLPNDNVPITFRQPVKRYNEKRMGCGRPHVSETDPNQFGETIERNGFATRTSRTPHPER